MIKSVSFFTALFFWGNCFAQSVTELQATARTFMKQGDYPNAVLVLNRALQMEPRNVSVMKDLSLGHYYQGNYSNALDVIKPALDMPEADDQVFQVAGNIYKQTGQQKDAEKLYKKGLKKYPSSGVLYNELGEIQWAQHDKEAIKSWENGIELEPSYSRNYYNASRYHFYLGSTVWCVLYAEIFLNMEPFSNKAPEIKQLLLDGYKKLFSKADIEQGNTDKTPFVKQFLQAMNQQSAVAGAGINPESLAMIRTRFILTWYASEKNNAYALFDYQQLLLRQGLFDAYNQWLFGSVQSLPAYQNWVNTHSEENKSFYNLQKSRVFKMPEKQFYH